MERRHLQLRAKQRLRPDMTSAEAARARSTSSASTAFIPEGKRACYTSRPQTLYDQSMGLVAAASETLRLTFSCWRWYHEEGLLMYCCKAAAQSAALSCDGQ